MPSRATLKDMQQRLSALGFDPGEPDGILGPATRGALRAFQRRAGIPADGYPDPNTLNALETYDE
ncbi:MAG: peptidoglycan-binding domain-containing protein [Halioglobus sp.]|nr:peptidoglycan-binding domain-containing protein [Halioglobus sp.]